jgi:hypothetical protein
MQPYFLNVDLEIESASELDSLAAEMGRRVAVLHSGPAAKPRRHILVLENSRQYRGPDATIHALCSLVEKLSPASRRVWNAARKEFDVGYELRTSERALKFALRPDTLERVAKLGANLAVSCYRGDAEPA